MVLRELVETAELAVGAGLAVAGGILAAAAALALITQGLAVAAAPVTLTHL
jgi:hypothetical protein